MNHSEMRKFLVWSKFLLQFLGSRDPHILADTDPKSNGSQT